VGHSLSHMHGVRDRFWDGVERRQARLGRRERQKSHHTGKRAHALDRRRTYTKRMRYLHRASRRMYELNLMSNRCAIMIQPSGICSPVVLLPSTRNSRGIIGSFLGGDARVVAHRDVADGSELVVFCVNDDVCDDQWDDDAVAILARMQFTMTVASDIKLHGHALVVRLCQSTDGVIYIGDVVIRPDIQRSLYCHQREAVVDTSAAAAEAAEAEAAEAEADDHSGRDDVAPQGTTSDV
jgi:hypothetical protein